MTLHEKLNVLADKLKIEGRDEDAATVWAAAFATAPGPTPTIEKFTEVVPGFYHLFQYYGPR